MSPPLRFSVHATSSSRERRAALHFWLWISFRTFRIFSAAGQPANFRACAQTGAEGSDGCDAAGASAAHTSSTKQLAKATRTFDEEEEEEEEEEGEKAEEEGEEAAEEAAVVCLEFGCRFVWALVPSRCVAWPPTGSRAAPRAVRTFENSLAEIVEAFTPMRRAGRLGKAQQREEANRKAVGGERNDGTP
eukprot:GHVT01011095.1.p1 GENE.GHVT01011095.1~~GHVT01011095.1.p1  ORF type:complete len:190 (-),score=51.77 GHVT01011095.1:299-868(-)